MANCLNCGKEITSHKERERKFCCKKCRTEFSYTTFLCDNCGKEFKIRKIRLKEAKHHFCSMDCKNKKVGETISTSLKNSEKFKISRLNTKRTYIKGKHNSPNTEFKKGWSETEWGKQVIQNRFKKHYSMSRPERILNNIIEKYKLPFKFVGNGELIVGKKLPDFIYLNDGKKIIEVFSDYWHRDDIAKLWHQTEKGTIEYYKQQGFNVLIIWERDIKISNQEELVRRINKFMNETLEIGEISPEVHQELLEFSNEYFCGDISAALMHIWREFKMYSLWKDDVSIKLNYIIDKMDENKNITPKKEDEGKFKEIRMLSGDRIKIPIIERGE
jgi:very-short-patch-repair endonuclease